MKMTVFVSNFEKKMLKMLQKTFRIHKEALESAFKLILIGLICACIKAMRSGNSFTNFGKISGKCTGKTGTFLPVHSGTFSVSVLVPTGVPFQKHEIVTKKILKQVSKNGQNH